jgi:short-subunit dehydrogenase
MAPVVVITGASSGIGEATARHMAREHGARCVLVARRADRLEELASAIGNGATHVAVDVTSAEAPRLIRDHLDGEVDVLVNNAGAAWRERFEDGGWEDMRRTMELNFNAPVRLAEALLPLMRGRKGSAVVNVTSVAGRVARPNTGAYSASKAALNAWTDALRAEEADHGVHVGALLPGFVKTEGFPARELLAKPTTRWLVSKPERVAEAIAEVAFGRRNERIVPRGYAGFVAARTLAPALVFRMTRGGAFTTSTGGDE